MTTNPNLKMTTGLQLGIEKTFKRCALTLSLAAAAFGPGLGLLPSAAALEAGSFSLSSKRSKRNTQWKAEAQPELEEPPIQSEPAAGLNSSASDETKLPTLSDIENFFAKPDRSGRPSGSNQSQVAVHLTSPPKDSLLVDGASSAQTLHVWTYWSQLAAADDELSIFKSPAVLWRLRFWRQSFSEGLRDSSNSRVKTVHIHVLHRNNIAEYSDLLTVTRSQSQTVSPNDLVRKMLSRKADSEREGTTKTEDAREGRALESDLVRLSFVAAFGGLWMDFTVFPSGRKILEKWEQLWRGEAVRALELQDHFPTDPVGYFQSAAETAGPVANRFPPILSFFFMSKGSNFNRASDSDSGSDRFLGLAARMMAEFLDSPEAFAALYRCDAKCRELVVSNYQGVLPFDSEGNEAECVDLVQKAQKALVMNSVFHDKLGSQSRQFLGQIIGHLRQDPTVTNVYEELRKANLQLEVADSDSQGPDRETQTVTTVHPVTEIALSPIRQSFLWKTGPTPTEECFSSGNNLVLPTTSMVTELVQQNKMSEDSAKEAVHELVKDYCSFDRVYRPAHPDGNHRIFPYLLLNDILSLAYAVTSTAGEPTAAVSSFESESAGPADSDDRDRATMQVRTLVAAEIQLLAGDDAAKAVEGLFGEDSERKELKVSRKLKDVKAADRKRVAAQKPRGSEELALKLEGSRNTLEVLSQSLARQKLTLKEQLKTQNISLQVMKQQLFRAGKEAVVQDYGEILASRVRQMSLDQAE